MSLGTNNLQYVGYDMSFDLFTLSTFIYSFVKPHAHEIKSEKKTVFVSLNNLTCKNANYNDVFGKICNLIAHSQASSNLLNSTH